VLSHCIRGEICSQFPAISQLRLLGRNMRLELLLLTRRKGGGSSGGSGSGGRSSSSTSSGGGSGSSRSGGGGSGSSRSGGGGSGSTESGGGGSGSTESGGGSVGSNGHGGTNGSGGGGGVTKVASTPGIPDGIKDATTYGMGGGTPIQVHSGPLNEWSVNGATRSEVYGNTLVFTTRCISKSILNFLCSFHPSPQAAKTLPWGFLPIALFFGIEAFDDPAALQVSFVPPSTSTYDADHTSPTVLSKLAPEHHPTRR
jgi:hypothetical protein